MSPTTLDRAFLQTRVAQFCMVVAAIGAAGYAVRVAVHLAFGESATSLVRPSFLLHVAAPLVLWAAGWHLRRGPSRSREHVHRVETAALCLHTGLYAVLTTYLDVEARPEYVGLFVLVLVLFARAVYIPSTPRRTLLLTAAIGAAFVAVTTADYGWLRTSLEVPVAARTTRPLMAAIWWSFVTIVCTLATQVIYGLRLEVRRATRIGQYTLDKPIGSGGMGVVYRARHAMLRRPTAIKLLSGRPSANQLARFEREVQITAQLTHPNTVTVFDYGATPEGVFYYAMEYLNGADLQAVVTVGGPLPAARVVRIMSQVAGALAEAHAAGLIHRDIKPANILLVEQGGELDVAKVVDFGLLKLLDHADVEGDRHLGVIGTPHYMAPETSKEPGAVGPAADLYSLGAVGYFLLTGHTLFERADVDELLEAHGHEPYEPLRSRVPDPDELPADVEAIITSCLSKSPQSRPPDAQELRAWLLACDCADEWSAEDAELWWSAHREDVTAHRERILAEIEGVTKQPIVAPLKEALVTPPRKTTAEPNQASAHDADVRVIQALSGIREVTTEPS